MVGYILGLGDRHPSNLMLDQLSGRILHIDLGDCFEVALNREKYPEKIPFRLTRMLVKAMEVSGIEGSYRSTCLRTMTLLRESRDSLVAMLEAFVYDPLISWRLTGVLEPITSEGVELKEEEVGNIPIRKRSVLNDSDEGVLIDGRLSVLHESAVEGLDEEGDDNNCNPPKLPQSEFSLITSSASLAERIHAGSMSESSSVAQLRGISAARARSLQVYSSIQSLAANLSASSRISSVSGEVKNNHGIAVKEGSKATSRMAQSLRNYEAASLLESVEGNMHEEALNAKALKVIRRVQDKLSGSDFPDVQEKNAPLDVSDQVQRLIVQATSSESLCQLFIGWCAFW